jgi:hypothetical protein
MQEIYFPFHEFLKERRWSKSESGGEEGCFSSDWNTHPEHKSNILIGRG